MVNLLGELIFFDRSYLEEIRYHKILNATNIKKHDNLVSNLRYFSTIYIAPPWEEIFCQNEERRHSFEKSVDDYHRVLSFYHQCGYKTLELPKIGIEGRVEFMLSSINQINSLDVDYDLKPKKI